MKKVLLSLLLALTHGIDASETEKKETPDFYEGTSKELRQKIYVELNKAGVKLGVKKVKA